MAIRKTVYKLSDKNVIIRNAEIYDAEKIVNAIKEMDSESIFLARESGEFQTSIEREKELIIGWKESPCVLFLVAELNDEIVGTCGIYGNARKRYCHKAEIGISVMKKYWGIKIGRKLLQESIEWCKENNLTKIELEVDTENKRAFSLYKDFGFEIEGKKEKDRKLADGSYHDSYIMQLFLDSK